VSAAVVPAAGKSMLAAFVAVCVSVESAPIVVQLAAVTCTLA